MTVGDSSSAFAISETHTSPPCRFKMSMIRSLVLFFKTKKAFPCKAASSFDNPVVIWLHGFFLWVNSSMFPLPRNTSASTDTRNNYQAKDNKDKAGEG